MVIPDPHAKPGVNNNRFLWAGRMAVEKQPEVIVCLGDFYDMPSLCSYDRGKKEFEGRRFNADIAAGIDGLGKFNEPIAAYNKRRTRAKKVKYSPRKIMLIGNHEQRIARAASLHPEFEGVLSYAALKFEEHGWEVVPFLKAVEVDGILYSHYFVSGVKGESISGVNVAGSLLAKNMLSSTCGHNHTLDWAVRTTPTGRTAMGLSAGCYLDPGQKEDYAAATDFQWWRGLVMKNNIKNGAYDLETFTVDRVKKLYG